MKKSNEEMNMEITALVMKDVKLERIRQFMKWGNQNHDWGEWLPILGEEFGEVCQAIAFEMFGPQKETDADDLYEELIQLAAVAIQMAEHYRKKAVA